MKTIIGQENKIAWINNLKGLAIIAVVLGHMASPLVKFIYAWHIPLFFFISGLLIKDDRSVKESLTKDFKKLLIPYFIFSGLGLLSEYIKRWLWPNFTFVNGSINLRDELMGIFWWMDYSHLHHYGFVLWFLPALFWTKNIYLLLLKLVKNRILISLISLGLVLFFSGRQLLLPFGLDKVFISLVWLSWAYYLDGRFWPIATFIWMLLPLSNTNIALGIINYYGIFYAMVAIYSLLGLIKLVPKNIKFLETFGKRTMEVLISHPYINNVAYLVAVYWLKGSWFEEMMLALMMLVVSLYSYEKII